MTELKVEASYANNFKLLVFESIILRAGGFPGGSVVKNLPPQQGTQVQSLGGEDPPGKEMATHFSILAWKVPWTEEPGGLQSWGCKESDTTERISTYTYY